MLIVESGYTDATMLDLEELRSEVLLDHRQELGVDEGFTACSRINEGIQFELDAVLREVSVGHEGWSTQDVMQLDTISAWRFVGCSFGLLWARDFTQSYLFSGIRLKSSSTQAVSAFTLSASS